MVFQPAFLKISPHRSDTMGFKAEFVVDINPFKLVFDIRWEDEITQVFRAYLFELCLLCSPFYNYNK